MSVSVSWSQGNKLLTEVGSDRWLRGPDGRVRRERQARGWSQERLAAELTKAGCPVHQSAVSKIEAPSKGDSPRGVALDELMALSKVFRIPVLELLLPPGALDVVQGLRDLADGPAANRDAYGAQERYSALVDRVVSLAADRPDMVLDHLDAIIERHRDYADPDDSFEYRFAHDVVVRISPERAR